MRPRSRRSPCRRRPLGDAAALLIVMHGFADYTSATLWIQTDEAGPVEITSRRCRWPHPPHLARRRRRARQRAHGARPGSRTGNGIQLPDRRPGRRARGDLRTQRYWNNGRDAAELTSRSARATISRIPIRSSAGAAAVTRSSTPSPPGSPTSCCGSATTSTCRRPISSTRVDGGPVSAVRRFVPLQKLLTAAAHLAIWDDHDYGPNDTDGPTCSRARR